jgi:general secretion pathway protein C
VRKLSLPTLLNTLLLLAIAAVGTYWFLQWASVRTPREPLVAVPVGDRVARSQPIDTAAAARPFGMAESSNSQQSDASARIRLDGVIAEGGRGRGVALISLDGHPSLAFRAGEAIDADLVLMTVGSDRITIQSSSGSMEVRLPETAAPAGIVPAR